VPKAPHPPSAFKTNNTTFAALMAKRWARPKEVVYVSSSETEQLELTKTHYTEIMKQIQGQALDCQIAGTQVPKYRWSGYSLHSDKGYLAVDFDDVEIAFTERYELLCHLPELRVKKYLDLDPGSFKLCCNKYIGRTRHDARQNLQNCLNIPENNTILLFSLVFHAPKPIKLGPKGSSTKLWGSVNSQNFFGRAKYELFRNSIIYRFKNFQKIIIFEKSKINAKVSARALEGAGNCHKIFPINFGKKKVKIYQKKFVPNFKMPIAKTALRSTIGRLNQKLGPRKHISTFLEGNFKKMWENDSTNSRSRSRSSSSSSSSISTRISTTLTKIKSL
jgi:hypothetical protein